VLWRDVVIEVPRRVGMLRVHLDLPQSVPQRGQRWGCSAISLSFTTLENLGVRVEYSLLPLVGKNCCPPGAA